MDVIPSQINGLLMYLSHTPTPMQEQNRIYSHLYDHGESICLSCMQRDLRRGMTFVVFLCREESTERTCNSLNIGSDVSS